ncbi:MAG: M18 family aminopeptidase [Propionibacteriaceae bacterium]
MPESHVNDLVDFVAASPSSYHAAAEVGRRLVEAGFVQQDETEAWDASPGGHFVIRDGSVVAWRIPESAGADVAFRILGSHTDSPTFKVKPTPDFRRAGWQQLGVEVYGGPLLNSWLDRESGVAGRVVDAAGGTHLVRTEAILRIPQLAIHLDRGVNDQGVKLDKQFHTQPVWGVGDTERDLLGHLAGIAGLGASNIVGHDLFVFDIARGATFGPDHEFLACARLDNLSSVHAGLVALLDADPTSGTIPVLAAFDHEEIGSGSRSGACGPILADVLDRIGNSLGADLDGLRRMYARSICLSADTGHAVHPNYVGHHDPDHHPLLNGGPLLKINANQRYATDAVGAGIWRRACAAAGVDTQPFVSNNQVPCGSTIGPLTATRLGITTVDVGVALLSMHSAREMAGVEDLSALARAATAFFAAA